MESVNRMIEGKRIVAVGGGKGGVGKSVVATNLAVACAQAGAETILVDADLGAPNIHTMLGVERPVGSLGDVMANAKLHLSDVLSHCSVDHLSIICGAGPILGVANPEFQKKQRVLTHASETPRWRTRSRARRTNCLGSPIGQLLIRGRSRPAPPCPR